LIVPYLFDALRDRLGIDLGFSEAPGLLKFLYVMATSIVLASISWFVLEEPINGLKLFFPYYRPKVSSGR